MRAAPDFAQTLRGRFPIMLAGDLETATAAAFSDAAAATPADSSATILLSPAAASFDRLAAVSLSLSDWYWAFFRALRF